MDRTGATVWLTYERVRRLQVTIHAQIASRGLALLASVARSLSKEGSEESRDHPV
jgi:hypothetical protein